MDHKNLTQMIRATIICATDQAEACRLPPIMTKMSPASMQPRRPRGMPMIVTANEHIAAANVYDEATMGMTYSPVGFFQRF